MTIVDTLRITSVPKLSYIQRTFIGMRKLALILLLGLPFVAQAQRRQAPVISGIALRAFVMPYALGNANGMYYTGGAEYIFKEKHGIGLDYSYNDYNAPDAPRTGSSELPPRMYSVSRGLVLSYRRYLQLHDGARNRYRPYVAGFVRYGNRSFHPEDGYQPKNLALENRVKLDEQQYSAGAMIGLITAYRFGRVNLDFGAGPFIKLKDVQDKRIEAGGIRTYQSSSRNAGLRFAIAINYMHGLRRG